MKIVPENKFDMVAVKNLQVATDVEVTAKISELLTWLQDMNWPVAVHINERLISLGAPLVKPIEEILDGNDTMWKYWIITYLISKTSPEVKTRLRPKLVSLEKNPTDGEIVDEVNIAASEVLKQCSQENGKG
jgi:hypothetical protein